MDFNELIRLPEATSGSFFADLEELFGDRYTWVVIVLAFLIAVNAFTFLLYGLDKWKARHGRWRIPEAVLLGFAALFGSVGAYVAMRLFRHKTLHRRFSLGVPLLIGVHVLLLALLCAA